MSKNLKTYLLYVGLCLVAFFVVSPPVSSQNETQFAVSDIPGLCEVSNVLGFGGTLVVSCETLRTQTAFAFQSNKCYKVNYDTNGQPSNISESPCTVPPFLGEERTVRCEDNTLQKGNSNQSKEQICKKNAGANQVSTAPELKDVVKSDRDTILECDGRNGNLQNCFAQNPIVGLVQVAVNFLAAGAGIIITVMIVIGGIQYSAAGSDPQKVAAAKQRITNAVIALFCLIFLYSFLQWLVPGGVF